MMFDGLSPQFESLRDFLAMGGYAPYVWSAWTISIIVLGIVWMQARREWRRVRRDMAAVMATEDRRKER